MAAGAPAPLRALRVLVIENDTILGMLFAELLGDMGHEVCAIEATQRGAVAAAVRCRPELMIVDAILRDGSGLAAVDLILRDGFIPHLYVSGDAVPVRDVKPDAVVLQKPFRMVDFVEAMGQALAQGAGPR